MTRTKEPLIRDPRESWHDCAHRFAALYSGEFDAHSDALDRERAAVARAETAERAAAVEQATVITESAVVWIGPVAEATGRALEHYRNTGEHARAFAADGRRLPGSRDRAGTRARAATT